MTKDYAKRAYLNNQKPKESRLKKLWLVVLLLIIAMAACYGLYVKYKKPEQLLLATTKSESIHEKPVTAEAVHFEFYDELPNIQVKAAEEPEKSAPASPATPSAAAKPEYVVQLGLFSDSTSAGELRLSLLLSGIESEVGKITEQGKVIYRVIQGPFVSLSEAKSSQQKLRRKGFESEIKASP